MVRALTEEEPSLGADNGNGDGLVLPPKKRKPQAHTWGRGGSGVYTVIMAEQFGRVKNFHTLSASSLVSRLPGAQVTHEV